MSRFYIKHLVFCIISMWQEFLNGVFVFTPAFSVLIEIGLAMEKTQSTFAAHTRGMQQELIKTHPPMPSEQWFLRLMILVGVGLMLGFIFWFFQIEHIGFLPLWILLTAALLFKMLKMAHEWYHYWDIRTTIPPVLKKAWKVDVFTTACAGEPFAMIAETLTAMQSIRYPHTSYLCDESNDPALRALCELLGVVHVTRLDKSNAKAGNINNALASATGEVCLILDPDHQPLPYLLDRLLPYFEDRQVGFVQSVQAYGNHDESFVARGAAQQTYHFYGPMMMCMNSYGTVQAIGANCAFRRAALDSIGGHAPGLAEDMHTAMQLHAKGWTSVYVPEILTRGLVPASLSAFYAQQLKWSRGTFELLFRTFPTLQRTFTWRQRLHYFLLPIYFLFGLVTLIDLMIPALALFLARSPWALDIGRMALLYLPLLMLSLLIRRYAQRWLMESHERGFHLTGGILRTATWWVYLLGFVYAVFRVKVPYIPTPKADDRRNHWILNVPNMTAVLFCLIAIAIGLHKDWSPYSLSMAAFALLNAIILSVAVVASQERMKDFFFSMWLVRKIRVPLMTFFRNPKSLLRYVSMLLLLLLPLAFLSYISQQDDTEFSSSARLKRQGGFLLGMEAYATNQHVKQVHHPFNGDGRTPDLICFTQSWLMDTLRLKKSLDSVREKHAIPFLDWRYEQADSVFFKSVLRGVYDQALFRYAQLFRSYGDPVLLALFPLNATHGTLPIQDLYLASWQYVQLFFTRQGVSNITWVYKTQWPSGARYYPGADYVDWLAWDFSEVPSHGGFSECYRTMRPLVLKYRKPVLLNILDVNAASSELVALAKDCEEIGAYVLLSDTLLSALSSALPATSFIQRNKGVFEEQSSASKQARSPALHGIERTDTGFTLMVNQHPFYVRGVAYNPGHDWRDGNSVLTREQLEKDFRAIRDMGANTIRRYGPCLGDRNILNVAEEYKLKVLFGFNFDPKTDYVFDEHKMQAYREQVLANVLRYRDHPALLGWALGNETWGLLKQQYTQPYLSVVRRNYVRMVEQLARDIHRLDPVHPVFTCMEHAGYQLNAELAAYSADAPSIDVLGINSYYRPLIESVYESVQTFAPNRPYLISEFGPNGYWNKDYNLLLAGRLREQAESEKATWYQCQWSKYVLHYKGANVGGIAYCWRDRYEGTATWFGLTDFRGRKKPSYTGLKALWTGHSERISPAPQIALPAYMCRGGRYLAEVKGMGGDLKGKQLSWCLLSDEYLHEVDANSESFGASLLFTVPKQGKNLRLYVSVSDDQGHVSTASAPVLKDEK